MYHAFLIKYAEIGIKGKNRYLFEDALVEHIRRALKHVEGDFQVSKEQGRIYAFPRSGYDFEETVDITDLLPEDTMLARDISSSVIVSVTILPYDSKEYVIPATDIDRSKQPDNMTVVISDENVTVRIRGTGKYLDDLKESDIRLSIDTSGYTAEGEYNVPVDVTLPEGYELVDDVTVKVTLTPSPERQSEQ